MNHEVELYHDLERFWCRKENGYISIKVHANIRYCPICGDEINEADIRVIDLSGSGGSEEA